MPGVLLSGTPICRREGCSCSSNPRFSENSTAGTSVILTAPPLAYENGLGWREGKLIVMKPMNERHLAILRRHMVEMVAIHADLASDEIGKAELDERVMDAMRRVPRHLFVPAPLGLYSYQDTPLPIGFDKTISQPFIVALMTDLLSPQPHETVLEVGTGLGYQAAILAELAGQVWSIEIVEEFASIARSLLRELGYAGIGIREGDGSRGWPDHAPFDKILVSAAAEAVPTALLDQLKPGGRLVMPLGPEEMQNLSVIEKDADGRTTTREILPVRFGQLETIS